MHINSTEFLSLIAKHGLFILVEPAAPRGALKREMITLVHQDRRPATIALPSGFRGSRIELPRPIFEDFIRASLIKPAEPEDEEGRALFRLSEDGRARALAPAR
jgi:hypothetical protein